METSRGDESRTGAFFVKTRKKTLGILPRRRLIVIGYKMSFISSGSPIRGTKKVRRFGTFSLAASGDIGAEEGAVEREKESPIEKRMLLSPDVSTSSETKTLVESLSEQLEGCTIENAPGALRDAANALEKVDREAKILAAGGERVTRTCIDVESICNKYIGQTERALRAVIVRSNEEAMARRNQKVQLAKERGMDAVKIKKKVKICSKCDVVQDIRVFAPHPLKERGLFSEFVKIAETLDGDEPDFDSLKHLHALATDSCGLCRVNEYNVFGISKKKVFYETTVARIKHHVPCTGCIEQGIDFAIASDFPAFVFDIDHGRGDVVKNFDIARYKGYEISDLIQELRLVFYENVGGGAPCAFHHRILTREDIDVSGDISPECSFRREISFLFKSQLGDGKCTECAMEISEDNSVGFDVHHVVEDLKSQSLGEILDDVCSALAYINDSGLEPNLVAHILLTSWKETEILSLLCANCHRKETMRRCDERRDQWKEYVDAVEDKRNWDDVYNGRASREVASEMRARLEAYIDSVLIASARLDLTANQEVSILLDNLETWLPTGYYVYKSSSCLYPKCNKNLETEQYVVAWGTDRFRENTCYAHYRSNKSQRLNSIADVMCSECGTGTSSWWHGEVTARGVVTCHGCYRKLLAQRQNEFGLACRVCNRTTSPRWYSRADDGSYICDACTSKNSLDALNKNAEVACYYCESTSSEQRWYVAKEKTGKFDWNEEKNIPGEFECFRCRNQTRGNELQEVRCAGEGCETPNTLTGNRMWRAVRFAVPSAGRNIEFLCASCWSKHNYAKAKRAREAREAGILSQTAID